MDIKLATIGLGKWGKNHLRTAESIPGGNLVWICDSKNDMLTESEKIIVNKRVKRTSNYKDILNDTEVNAVIIATPAETHFEIAKKCIEAGKNILVEKPITLFVNECRELMESAAKKNLVLMVGHVLLYHPAILMIKGMLESGKLGKLQYIYSNRLNLGVVRTEENILWSFAPHDISVIQFLTGSSPEGIFASGASFLQRGIEDTTVTILKYPGNVNAHIFVSWLHPFKEHRLVVIGSEGMVVFEDTLKNEKLKFYKKGFKNIDGAIEKFDSDYEVINFDNVQPLEEEQKHFFECVVNRRQPRTDGKSALEVLKILEEAGKVMKL
ncbi:MAG: Gfo/Idh/MocA family oxidoreductase [Ignavibacteria bacterium]|nr:Gfo/Idh/MocA family oxidoreductase [Ignavibacteria bacterium]